jgi:signal transduction histidine kinase
VEKEYLQRDFLHRVMAGQEGERKRIARELHDQTGQALASVMVDLKMLENAKNETEARQSIGRLRKAITEEMEAIHNLAVALRPSVLDDLGLVPAVEMLVRGFITRQEIPVELTIIGFAEKRPDGCTETCVYRIVQEALSNVARHARATEVSVLLEWRGENIRGVIEDNGIGFAPERVDSKTKLGVLGMKERAQLLQGTFRIESGPGDGTMLVFEMPAKAGVCHEQ